MTGESKSYGNVAPIENVTRLIGLIDRVGRRTAGLPGMACYFGRAGFGKTSAATYVVNRFNVCHVEAKPLGGVKRLLESIVIELGLRPQGSASRLFDQAAQELAERGWTLIIDEADLILTDRQIETVRHLYEMTQVPVILMGEEGLPGKLMRWERVHGRIMAWVQAEPLTAADVGHLAKIWARGVEVGPDLAAMVLDAARGSHRYAATNLAAIREFALVKGLSQVTRADWGARTMHTGEPPQITRVAPSGAVLKRRSAA